MITTNEVKTKPFEGEWSEQDKLGMAKAIEQAELGLSEGEGIIVLRGPSTCVDFKLATSQAECPSERASSAIRPAKS